MAREIIVEDYDKAKKLQAYLSLESLPVSIGRDLVFNLISFDASVSQHLAALGAGGEFEEFSEFDASFRRLKQLSVLRTAANDLLAEFRSIDQAELDAGRAQIFNSVTVDADATIARAGDDRSAIFLYRPVLVGSGESALFLDAQPRSAVSRGQT